MPIADLGPVRLNYQLEGAEAAPVLALAHSLGTDLTLWDSIVEHLGPAFRILRWDLRGHGKSAVVPGSAALPDFGQDLLALLDTLRIAQCHFAGISLGGVIGLWFAIHAPQRLGKLILANTAARIGQSQNWQERIDLVREQGLAGVAAGAGERWFTSAYRTAHPQDVDLLTRKMASSSVDGYIAACAALRDADLTTELSRIRAQTLVIAGTFDTVTTPEDGRTLEHAISRARYVELPAAHLAPVECSVRFSRIALDFLDVQEGTGG